MTAYWTTTPFPPSEVFAFDIENAPDQNNIWTTYAMMQNELPANALSVRFVKDN